jgi:enoyl-CoA hydratase/carnithine racemase
MTQHILVERADRILTIRFNRLEKKNSLTSAMYTALTAALVQAQADPEVRVILFAGSTDCFCAGNDMGDFLNSPPDGADAPVAHFMRAAIAMEKPAVAAVNGIAVGIGVTLLLQCDLVYVGENTRLQMPFVNIGACPELASTYLLPLVMGHVRAAELVMLGEPFTAETARAYGIANQVVPNAQCEAIARKAALRLASQPPAALRTTKALLRRVHAGAIGEAMKIENSHFMPMLRQPEAREALTAFAEKRVPDFSRFT